MAGGLLSAISGNSGKLDLGDFGQRQEESYERAFLLRRQLGGDAGAYR